MLIRDARPEDAAALAAIYADAVLNGFGTFEEVPPSPEEMEARRARAAGYALPYLVAEIDGAIAGFAYAAPFRLRAAYRFTVEDSVYIHPDSKGRGVGKALLSGVIDRCTAMGLRQVVAVIGDSANHGSIGLHRALGFQPAGVLPALGWKHGRWVDVVMMTLALNGGSETTANAEGLVLEGA